MCDLKTFKEVLTIENAEDIIETDYRREYTWEELITEIENNEITNRDKVKDRDNDDNFWGEFDVVLFNMMDDLKEKYFFKGFMDNMEYKDILRVFMKNIFVERNPINSDDEDCNSNEDEEEVLIYNSGN